MAAKKHSTARRVFLIGSGLVGGALAIGTTLAWRRVTNAQGYKPPVKAGEVAFNAWLKILPDSTVVVQVPRQEMGQGIYTMLAMFVAEELDADWSKVRVEQAQINPVYGNVTALGDSAPAPMQTVMVAMARVLGLQLTGGSASTRERATSFACCGCCEVECAGKRTQRRAVDRRPCQERQTCAVWRVCASCGGVTGAA
jgi:isoquinoline 1-oxidoreductase subunit beta